MRNVVNFICETKSVSKQHATILIPCPSKIVQWTETMLFSTFIESMNLRRDLVKEILEDQRTVMYWWWRTENGQFDSKNQQTFFQYHNNEKFGKKKLAPFFIQLNSGLVEI